MLNIYTKIIYKSLYLSLYSPCEGIEHAIVCHIMQELAERMPSRFVIIVVE